MRHGFNPIVLVLNNKGYGTERFLQEGPFNDIPNWNYHRLPDLLGGGWGFEVRTEGDLDKALRAALAEPRPFQPAEHPSRQKRHQPGAGTAGARAVEAAVNRRLRPGISPFPLKAGLPGGAGREPPARRRRSFLERKPPLPVREPAIPARTPPRRRRRPAGSAGRCRSSLSNSFRPSAAPTPKSMTTMLPGACRDRFKTSAALRQGRTRRFGPAIRRFSSDSHRGAFSRTTTAGARGDTTMRMEDRGWKTENRTRARRVLPSWNARGFAAGVNCVAVFAR